MKNTRNSDSKVTNCFKILPVLHVADVLDIAILKKVYPEDPRHERGVSESTVPDATVQTDTQARSKK